MTNEELAPLFAGTNFGHTDYQEIVLEGLIKVATKYHNGYTLESILKNNGFIKSTVTRRALTDKGRKLLWDLYDDLKKSSLQN